MTLQLKLPPEYVMDKMEFFEIRSLMKYQHYAYKDGWEQARMISYLIAQVNSKKRLKPEDILNLFWEKEEAVKNQEVSNEEVARLRAKAKEFAALL